MSDNLTPEQLQRLIYDKEYQKKRAEAEQAAIDALINGQVNDSFGQIVQCMRCGKQKQHNNIPLCDECTKAIDKKLVAEDKDFESLQDFAGSDNLKKKEQ